MTDPYQILNVNPGASNLQIKNAYRQLAKKYHPDVSADPDAEVKFIAITEAYEILTEGSTQLQQVFNTNQEYPRETTEEQRRQRAREYSRTKYDDFVKNNVDFKQTWYYTPVKNIIYGLIYFFYAVSAVLFLGPLIMWMNMGFATDEIGLLVFSLTGPIFMKTVSKFRKEVKPYFDEYNIR